MSITEKHTAFSKIQIEDSLLPVDLQHLEFKINELKPGVFEVSVQGALKEEHGVYLRNRFEDYLAEKTKGKSPAAIVVIQSIDGITSITDDCRDALNSTLFPRDIPVKTFFYSRSRFMGILKGKKYTLFQKFQAVERVANREAAIEKADHFYDSSVQFLRSVGQEEGTLSRSEILIDGKSHILLQKESWNYSSEHYQVRIFQFEGTKIYLSRASGRPDKKDMEALLQIRESMPVPYDIIIDFSEMKGATRDARKLYTEWNQQHRSDMGKVVFFGMSPFLKSIIRVGQSLAPNLKTIRSVDTLEQAWSLMHKSASHKPKLEGKAKEFKEKLDIVDTFLAKLSLQGDIDQALPKLPADDRYYSLYQSLNLIQSDISEMLKEEESRIEQLEENNQLLQEEMAKQKALKALLESRAEFSSFRARIWEHSLQVDEEQDLIQHILIETGKFLDVDVARFWQTNPENNKVISTHTYQAPNTEVKEYAFPAWILKAPFLDEFGHPQSYYRYPDHALPEEMQKLLQESMKQTNLNALVLLPFGGLFQKLGVSLPEKLPPLSDFGDQDPTPQGVFSFESSRPERVFNDDEVELLLEVSRICFIRFEQIRAQKETRQALQIKNNFLATISHEIRTPMNGIIGISSLLNNTKLDKTQKKYTETIRSSGKALMKIINEILDFAKLDSGRLTLEHSEFSLLQTLENCFSLVGNAASEKGLSLFLNLQPNFPTQLIGDAGRIQQILLNLVENAVKFTQKGHIEVRIEVKAEEHRSISMLFSVTDTGIGIEESLCQEIFQSFTQADASATRKFGGTGLGLAISKTLVDLMGGKIGVESQEGKGSTFWVNLELEKGVYDGRPSPFKASGIDAAPPLPESLNDSKVLLIISDDRHREIFQKQLEELSFKVEAFASSGPALENIFSQKQNPWKFAILEDSALSMGSLNFIHTVQSNPTFKALRFIELVPAGSPESPDKEKETPEHLLLPAPLYRQKLLRFLKAFENNHTPQTTQTSQTSKSMRILVVDDNSVIQELLCSLIEALGHHADVVGNGEEALQNLMTIPYKMILMDCYMPVMDGFTATKYIREGHCGEAIKDIPIYACTGQLDDQTKLQIEKCGMNGCIDKPVDLPQLKQILQAQIS